MKYFDRQGRSHWVTPEHDRINWVEAAYLAIGLFAFMASMGLFLWAISEGYIV